MTMKLFSIEIKGKHYNWAFDFDGDTKYWQEMLDDGLNVKMIMNTIPLWVVNFRLTRIWVFFQDILIKIGL